MREITPRDDEFREIERRFTLFLNEVERDRELIADISESSLRLFLAEALSQIASAMGYILQGGVEFVKDMKWSAQVGWRAGVARAHERRLRDDD